MEWQTPQKSAWDVISMPVSSTIQDTMINKNTTINPPTKYDPFFFLFIFSSVSYLSPNALNNANK